MIGYNPSMHPADELNLIEDLQQLARTAYDAERIELAAESDLTDMDAARLTREKDQAQRLVCKLMDALCERDADDPHDEEHTQEIAHDMGLALAVRDFAGELLERAAVS